MSQSFMFCTERVREAKLEVAGAKLDMVRERAERSLKTWQALADQAERVEEARAKAANERLVRLTEEADDTAQG